MNHQLCRLAVLCLGLAMLVSEVRADVVFQATLSGANEVPPNDSPGTGFITVDLHDNLVTNFGCDGDLQGVVSARYSRAHSLLRPGWGE